MVTLVDDGEQVGTPFFPTVLHVTRASSPYVVANSGFLTVMQLLS